MEWEKYGLVWACVLPILEPGPLLTSPASKSLSSGEVPLWDVVGFRKHMSSHPRRTKMAVAPNVSQKKCFHNSCSSPVSWHSSVIMPAFNCGRNNQYGCAIHDLHYRSKTVLRNNGVRLADGA